MKLLRLRPRFSLQTLLAGAFVAASGMALWAHWSPWFIERVLPLKPAPTHARFSDDGREFVTIATPYQVNNCWITVFDTASGAKLFEQKREDYAWSARFSHRNETLALGVSSRTKGEVSFVETLALIDLKTGAERAFQNKNFNVLSTQTESIAFTPDDTRVMFGRVVVDAQSGEELRVFGTDAINSPCFPPPEWVIAEKERQRVRREKVLAMNTLDDVVAATQMDNFIPAFAPAGDRVAIIAPVYAPDGCLMCGLWNLQTGTRLGKLKLPESATYIATVFLQDSALVIVDQAPDEKTGPRQYEVYDIIAGNRVAEQTIPMQGPSIDFDPVAQTYTFSDGNAVWVFNPMTPGFVLMTNVENLMDTRISPDIGSISDTLYPADSAIVQVRELESGRTLAALDFPNANDSLCFSPDGQRLLVSYSGDDNAGVLVWRRRRPEKLYGILCLWEFWATVGCAGVLVWTLFRKRPVKKG